MIHFRGRIPISIYPTFWLFAGIIGFLISHSLLGAFLWIAIILVSVLIHEFGHASTAVLFGQNPRIELVALGGLTYHDGQKLKLWKQFLIVFNGPLFGLGLYFIADALLRIPSLSQGLPGYMLTMTREINLFWTLVNLLPVMPLDGGQLLRIILEAIFGVKGFKYAVIAGIVVGAGISLFFFFSQNFLIGALFFLFAFQSYDTYRRTRHLSESDQDPTLRQSLEKAEEMIQLGQKQEAFDLCEKIRLKAKRGMIYELSTQYLAFLTYEKGNSKDAYALLQSIRSELGTDALCLLHKVAFEQKDFSLVVELGGTCFQTWPNAETALRNAYAHAQMQQAVPTIGWLQTAMGEGLADLPQVLLDPLFDPIRKDPSFESFSKQAQSNSG
ncbi:MAG: M50 family metallopeptidase [Chlamydiota bacterium]